MSKNENIACDHMDNITGANLGFEIVKTTPV